ncbi:MAG TPA: PTS fructose transporter subunit IIA [Casimicrobiaceae bacterium]
MIGLLIVAHGALGQSLVDAVTHVLGARPPQFGVFAVGAQDDPLELLPRAREAVAALDTGEGVAVLADLYGATPCNLAAKLAQAGRVEVIAGVNLPMLVRAFTYRTKGMDLLVKKAISGGCEGVLHL